MPGDQVLRSEWSRNGRPALRGAHFVCLDPDDARAFVPPRQSPCQHAFRDRFEDRQRAPTGKDPGCHASGPADRQRVIGRDERLRRDTEVDRKRADRPIEVDGRPTHGDHPIPHA